MVDASDQMQIGRLTGVPEEIDRLLRGRHRVALSDEKRSRALLTRRLHKTLTGPG